MSRALPFLAAGAAIAALVIACAAVGIPVEYGARQDACIADASSRPEADDCRCRVRLDFPSAPQCTRLADGGWAQPLPLASGSALPPEPMAVTRKDGGAS